VQPQNRKTLDTTNPESKIQVTEKQKINLGDEPSLSPFTNEYIRGGRPARCVQIPNGRYLGRLGWFEEGKLDPGSWVQSPVPNPPTQPQIPNSLLRQGDTRHCVSANTVQKHTRARHMLSNLGFPMGPSANIRTHMDKRMGAELCISLCKESKMVYHSFFY
jgi:hypothetical protein